MHRLGLRLLLVVVVGLLPMAVSGLGLLRDAERRSYDARCRLLAPGRIDDAASPALVLIDERTLAAFDRAGWGRWPFGRDVYATALAALRAGGARVVVFDLVFAGEQADFDGMLAEALRAGPPTVLAAHLGGGEPGSWPWPVAVLAPDGPAESFRPLLPTPVLAAAAVGGGTVDLESDEDGVLRWLTPLRRGDKGWAASLGLAAHLAGAGVYRVAWTPEALHLDDRRFPLHEGRLLVPWTRPDFDTAVSFVDLVVAGDRLSRGEAPGLDLARFTGRTVFIGASALGTFDLRATPVADRDCGVRLHADVCAALARGAALRRAPWWVDLLLALAGALGVGLAALRLRRFAAQVVVAAVGMLALAGLATGLLAWAGIWIAVVAPVLGAGLAFTAGTALNYLAEGRQRRFIRLAFSRYVSPAVIEQLVRDPSRLRLGGERREVTAFFSDLEGFTGFSERLEPEALAALLMDYLTEMTAIIIDEGGTFDKYIGDAIVAIFGAPLPMADHAARACRAARRCQERLAELRVVWAARGWPELRMRIGLNTGPAVVGNLGSKQQFTYTMLGDTVNLASRLEGANKAFGTYTLVSEVTVRSAGLTDAVRELDLIAVQGRREAVRVYELPAGEVDAAALAAYARALALVRERRFAEALAECEQAGEDAPARRLAERCRAWIAQAPGPEWDGVRHLDSK